MTRVPAPWIWVARPQLIAKKAKQPYMRPTFQRPNRFQRLFFFLKNLKEEINLLIPVEKNALGHLYFFIENFNNSSFENKFLKKKKHK